MSNTKLEIGSKVQVYRGIAKRTTGGLTKDKIVRIEDRWGNIRYKAKKQQNKSDNSMSQKARSKWTIATEKAMKYLSKPNDNKEEKVSKTTAEYFKKHKFVLLKKPAESKKSGFTNEEKLYKVTKMFYDKKLK